MRLCGSTSVQGFIFWIISFIEDYTGWQRGVSRILLISCKKLTKLVKKILEKGC